MILDLAAQQPRSTRSTSTSPRAGPPPSWPRSSTPTRRTSWPTRADDLARRFEGRPGVLGVRKTPDRRGQGRLLEGPQGRVLAPDGAWSATPSRSPSSRTRPSRPTACPSSTSGSARSSRRHGRAGRLLRPRRRRLPAHPADHQRQDARGRRDAPVDRPRGLRPGRRVRRRDERRARRRPGPQPLERASCSAPRSTPRSRRSSAPSTPTNRLNPGKVVADADPGDHLRIGPDYHPREPEPTRPRLLRPGGIRPRRRDVLGRRRLPQDRRRDDVPELHGHPRRDAHDPRPRQRPPPGHDRRALPADGLANETLARGPRPLPPVQGVQERVPVERRHGQAQGRVPPPVLPAAARARSARC